ncbi:type II toxin-antitoxin system RelE/ParE family toxin [Dokdonella soli]|uniref:type II toxin-antitoxin system RelE/ParE family toxin n=1 Tax=Dokdonella soli TaxID=529810 RepID=UPI0031E42125
MFHPAAEAEHLEHVAFYESRQAGLGARYLDEIEAAIALICGAPKRFPVEHEPGLRRLHLRQFPMTLIFREVDGEVQILAVAHKRRRPAYWMRRT